MELRERSEWIEEGEFIVMMPDELSNAILPASHAGRSTRPRSSGSSVHRTTRASRRGSPSPRSTHGLRSTENLARNAEEVPLVSLSQFFHAQVNETFELEPLASGIANVVVSEITQSILHFIPSFFRERDYEARSLFPEEIFEQTPRVRS